tara:strand:+ start:4652 stop:5161 length:510 start_codon:yes stop_codon:yes gene_type:complete
MEIQGGMRLTPLGLRQLSGEANAVVYPSGGPSALTAAGTGATVVVPAASAAPIESAQIMLHIPDQAHTGTGTYELTLGGNGFTVTGIQWLCLTAGAASSTNTVTLKNGAATFGVIDLTGAVAGTYETTVASINPANAVIISGGTLNVEVLSSASNKSQGLLILSGFVNS